MKINCSIQQLLIESEGHYDAKQHEVQTELNHYCARNQALAQFPPIAGILLCNTIEGRGEGMSFRGKGRGSG